jgi:hypothetical protein
MMQYNPIEEKPETRGRWVERESRGEVGAKGGSRKGATVASDGDHE